MVFGSIIVSRIKNFPYYIRAGIIGAIIGFLFPIGPYVSRWVFGDMFTNTFLYVPLYLYGVVAMLPAFYLDLIGFHRTIYISMLRFCELNNLPIFFRADTCFVGLYFTILLLAVLWGLIGFIVGVLISVIKRKILLKLRNK